MSIEENVVLSPSEIKSKKLAICGISLGVKIMEQLIGDKISKVNEEGDIENLVAAAIQAELSI